MEWGDEGPEDEPVPPLLPPDDRLWRHPSEVAGAPGLPAPSAAGAGDRDASMVTVVALTSCISVLLTLGVIAVVRPVRTRVAVEQIATPVRAAADLSEATDVAALAERLRPAIVQVVASRDGAESWGSGVIYRSDGMALTARHVVDGAASVRAVLASGVEVAVRLVGTDVDTDLAVLDLDGDDFPVAELAEATDVKVGQSTITIGSPSGGATGQVVRVSAISALGQEADADGHKLVDMMQTDKAVAPGCAGAPVVSMSGAVIGIAAANVSTEAGVIGYATPIEIARAVASDLLASGHVTRGWLGIEGDSLPLERAHELGVSGGAVVRKVSSESPAAGVGIASADIITAIDDTAIFSMSAVVVRLRSLRPGDTITLSLLRGGDKRTVKVTLAERPV